MPLKSYFCDIHTIHETNLIKSPITINCQGHLPCKFKLHSLYNFIAYLDTDILGRVYTSSEATSYIVKSRLCEDLV